MILVHRSSKSSPKVKSYWNRSRTMYNFVAVLFIFLLFILILGEGYFMTLVTLRYKNLWMSLSCLLPTGKLWVNIMTGSEFPPPLTWFFPLISSPPCAFCFYSLNCIFSRQITTKNALIRRKIILSYGNKLNGISSFCSREEIVESNNWSTCREELTEGSLASVDTADSPTQRIGSGDIVEEGARRSWEADDQALFWRLCLLDMIERPFPWHLNNVVA